MKVDLMDKVEIVQNREWQKPKQQESQKKNVNLLKNK